MKIQNLVSAAVLAVTLPFTASATTLAPGVYDALDFDANRATTEGSEGSRSVWTAGGQHIVTGSGVSRRWTVGDTSTFTFDGMMASLTGTATNIGTGGANLAFDFVLNMTLNPTGIPFCGGGTCDNNPTPGTSREDFWALFTLDSGSATGVAGTDMAGLTYDIGQYSSHGPQAGLGANDKDASELGFSMWFTFDRTDTTDVSALTQYTFFDSARGDFNMDIVFDTNISDVPLPATGLMLLAALGGIAAARRRAA